MELSGFCFVMPLLSWAFLFLCWWFFHREGFGSKYNPYLFRKWLRSWSAVPRALFACFSFCGQLHAVKNHWHHVFLDYKLTKLERGLQQTPYYMYTILLEFVFCKVFYTNVWMLPGHEVFSFHFHRSFSFKFSALGEFKSANFWFWVVFLWRSLTTWTKTVSNFPHFLSSVTVMWQVLFPNII